MSPILYYSFEGWQQVSGDILISSHEITGEKIQDKPRNRHPLLPCSHTQKRSKGEDSKTSTAHM